MDTQDAAASSAEVEPSLLELDEAAYRELLSLPVRVGVMVLVIFFHVAGAWALMQIRPKPIEVGDVSSMEVRMVAADQANAPQPQLSTPPPEDTPPPEPTPRLESMVQPPMPDLPPPAFPVQAPPPKPEPPKPAPKPAPPKPQPAPQSAPQTATAPSTPAAPAVPAGPRTVSASQVGYLTPPRPVYPTRARRAGEKGSVTVRVFIDAAGRPAEVLLQASSGFPDLDQSAVSAVRAARFRPYSEGGAAQAVWVLVPINFVLQ